MLLDQTRLPAEEAFLTCARRPAAGRRDPQARGPRRAAARRGRRVRRGAGGVPRRRRGGSGSRAIAAARPTAVNLGWGVRRALRGLPGGSWHGGPVPEPNAWRAGGPGRGRADRRRGRRGQRGDGRARAGPGARRARILTHCNTGALVSAGEGTAFAVILAAHRAGGWPGCGWTRPGRCCRAPG